MSDERWITALDVGSTGRDPSILCLRQGRVFAEFLRFTETDVLKTAALVDAALRSRGFQPRPRTARIPADVPSDMIGGAAGWDDGLPASSDLRALVIDVIGIGDGPARWLQEQGWPVIRFRSSDRARDRKRFENRRAEVMWKLREGLEHNTIDVGRNEQLAKEILATRWETDLRTGRIKIERKLEIKKRLGHSPDYLDAAAMTFAAEGHTSGGGVMLDI